ncbi:MAG: HlyD family efflux transporter periplasmic adaptor subunit [Sedimentisphaerales bacterium]|nr:HlyD family efflux transporter periplasmic adaptor subunit [Sedimentisphaerales bacterium]
MIMKAVRFDIFRLGRLHSQVIPVLVWLTALAIVIRLFYSHFQRFEVVGIAQGDVSQVCAPVDGRLKAVYVHLFDEVSKDQVVAALDDELITAQIATISATAAHLRSQLVPAGQQIVADIAASELDRTEEQRRFASDVERARLDILGLKAQIAADRITLEDYAAEARIAEDLLAKNAIAPYELDKAKALYNALAKKIEETEKQLAQAEVQLQQAQLRHDVFIAQTPQNPSVDDALEAIRKEAAIQEKLIEELAVQRRSLVMTAPIDGVVVQILARANEMITRRAGEGILRKTGEAVLAGQPILVIAQDKPKEIIGYAREWQLDQVKAGAKVELVKRADPPQIARAEITSIGPVVEQLPARLWQNPNVPQWGLPFLISVPGDMKLTSGELVGIRGL